MIAAALGLSLASCTLGDVGGGGPVASDDDLVPEAMLCEAKLSLSGTLAPPGGTPAPADQGCVPEGTWTVNVTIGDSDCGDVPTAATYVYEVVGTGRARVITYDAAASGEELALNIHAGGNGECDASFEHISAAGEGEYHVLDLKPWFAPGTTTIQGIGTYQLWSEHP
jgi:hypothetical protein